MIELLSYLLIAMASGWCVFTWVDNKITGIVYPHNTEDWDKMEADEIKEKLHQLDLNGKRAIFGYSAIILIVLMSIIGKNFE